MSKGLLYIKILGLLLLICCFVAVIYWLYRPNSKELYEKLSKIPLKKEE